MNCPNCGANNNEGVSTCTNCGSNLNVIQQGNNMYQNSEQVTNNVESTKKIFKNNKIIFVAVGIVVVILVVSLFFIFKKNKNNSKDFDVNYADAFFISDGDNYALFNNDGKQLTDFKFSSVKSFINKTALVKKDDEYGVINDKGKMVIDFGKYDNIKSKAGLYEVTDKNGNSYIVNGKGKVLYDMNDAELETFIDVDLYSILTDKKNNTYKVLNYAGKTLVEFKKDSSNDKEPSTNEEDNFMSVFYNNKNYVFDLSNSKKVASFDSDKHYCVNNVSEDGKIITLNSCVGFLESQDKTYYKFIKDGKLYDLSDKCEKVIYSSDNLYCLNDSERKLIYGNGKVGIEVNNVLYSDNDTYVKNEENGVEFYNKGKSVKKVECKSMYASSYYDGYTKNGLFLLISSSRSGCDSSMSGKKEYYKSNGEKAFDKQFKEANKFDNNGNAIVSEDGKNYYLINEKGKKISNEYTSITYNESNYEDFYLVTKDDLKGIINKNGKEVIEPKYTSVTIYKVRDMKFAKLKTKDSKYIVFDLIKNKELVTSDAELSIGEHSIYETKDDHRKYYTLKGKLFYER